MSAPLKCGCRPADTFCDDAKRIQSQIRAELDWFSTVAIHKPEYVEHARGALAFAERALRDHLRGEVAA